MTFKTHRKLASACLVEIVILYHCLLHTTHPLHTPVKLHTLHFLIISGILPTSILPWQLQTLSIPQASCQLRLIPQSLAQGHFRKCTPSYKEGVCLLDLHDTLENALNTMDWLDSTLHTHCTSLPHSPTQRWSSLKAEPDLIHPHPSFQSSGP